MKYQLFLAALAVAMAGCGPGKQTAKQTAEQLQISFNKADASVTAEVVQAGAALRSNDYAQAILIMHDVVQGQAIDAVQKKAVDSLIIQTRQAIEQNPKLDSPQLYQALSDLLVRVHGEN